MRTSKTLSITLPPDMLTQAEALARKENRTMSELIREALRHYERQRWWTEVNEFGRQTAEAAGVRSEEETVPAIHALREQKRSRPPRQRSSR
ncbi:MAG: ribbon-helix-helix domain-containing protein [Bryobacteraceae bacterium]